MVQLTVAMLFLWHHTTSNDDGLNVTEAFMVGDSLRSDKKDVFQQRLQPSSPGWEIIAVCISYLSAASSSYLHVFPPLQIGLKRAVRSGIRRPRGAMPQTRLRDDDRKRFSLSFHSEVPFF